MTESIFLTWVFLVGGSGDLETMGDLETTGGLETIVGLETMGGSDCFVCEREYKSLTAFHCHSFTLSVSSRVIMWFKILLPHQHYPLAAMVGKDGKLYFKLVDVGALLGRSKVFEFAK
ncbi:uncharacterized protein TNCV_828211 [Trichonephila clavipes]|nr:uncharacterized protein TNCV_828211 [Trichonephila clavipes]